MSARRINVFSSGTRGGGGGMRGYNQFSGGMDDDDDEFGPFGGGGGFRSVCITVLGSSMHPRVGHHDHPKHFIHVVVSAGESASAGLACSLTSPSTPCRIHSLRAQRLL